MRVKPNKYLYVSLGFGELNEIIYVFYLTKEYLSEQRREVFYALVSETKLIFESINLCNFMQNSCSLLLAQEKQFPLKKAVINSFVDTWISKTHPLLIT